jgi:hypothetical protein
MGAGRGVWCQELAGFCSFLRSLFILVVYSVLLLFFLFFVGWPGSLGGLCFAFHCFVVWLFFCLVRLLWAVEGLIQGECFDDGEKRGG